MEFRLNQCPACGKRGIRIVKKDRRYRVAGRERIVSAVPVQVCPHCHSKFIGLEAAAYVDRMLRRKGSRREPRVA
jgi:YgiT-type zinc finger domain-containing protein